MPRLKEKYQKEVIPQLEKLFNYKNYLAVPRLAKVIVSVSSGEMSRNPKKQEVIVNTLSRITGQRPVLTKAKKSISAFKIREGVVIGAKVTLRGKRMYDFVDKLVNITLPRVKDFRGIEKKNLDGRGNLNLGLSEHNVFPEIKSDEVENLHGLEVTVVPTSRKREENFSLLKLLGFPFKEK